MKPPSTPLIAGKLIEVYGSGTGTPSQLRDHLRRFATYSTLRRLGEIAGPGWTNGSVERLAGVPMVPFAIPYLALIAIEASNDHRGRPIDDAGLAKAMSLFLDLPEPRYDTSDQADDSALEMAIRMSRQFDYQSDVRYSLARVVLLFRDLWPKVASAAALSPLADLERATGLDLNRLLFFGWAFTQRGAGGYFSPYVSERTPMFSTEAQSCFLRWASADYRGIRKAGEASRRLTPGESFDAYRYNPLVETPIILPDALPSEARGIFYLLPCQRLLFDLIHRGVFKEIAELHRGPGENPFRVAFGEVFQEYVGTLFREALGIGGVLPERQYGESKKARAATIDWIVVDQDTAVLVEVKTGVLTVPTVALGNLVNARKELRKHVSRAMEQLDATQTAIRAGRRGLEDLAHIREFEHLIVTYENVHWGNSLLRDMAGESVEGPRSHAHLCSVDELEYLVGRCKTESLHALVRRKRLGSDRSDEMDFKDWLAYERKRDGHEPGNAFLSAKMRSVMEGWGVDGARLKV